MTASAALLGRGANRLGDADAEIGQQGRVVVLTVIGGGGLPAQPGRDRRERPMTLGQMIIFAIIGIVVLSILATHVYRQDVRWGSSE